ncbi:MAG: TonB-dependent receptor plug domain-containing protein [Thiobacillus sp.]
MLAVTPALAWGGEPPNLAEVNARSASTSAQPDTEADIPEAARLEEGVETFDLGQVVVTGKRASLVTALDIKRDQLAIVDSVVAEDIDKLPDLSVTDALQRIIGVQIARDRGEGANVALRGLTLMETTLNGREVFTAGVGRNLDFADIPSEMVAGIDVGAFPIYTGAYGWLDASLGYRISDEISLAIEGQNLLGTVRKSYYGVETRPQSAWINDRQISATVALRFR